MARILVVEDEKDIQDVLTYNLRQAGHTVTAVSRGEEALAHARRARPDLVLLDLMLPDIPGTEVVKSLKQDPKTQSVPVVMLTAKSSETDRVVGFELGADDYVVKPFSVRELVLRLQALLRRKAAEPARDDEPAGFGRLRYDPAAHRAFVDEKEVPLTALEFKLLIALHRSKGRVLSREALLSRVWEIEADVTTRTVDTHVKRLREKLGAASVYIETVRGTGYRFAESAGAQKRPSAKKLRRKR